MGKDDPNKNKSSRSKRDDVMAKVVKNQASKGAESGTELINSLLGPQITKIQVVKHDSGPSNAASNNSYNLNEGEKF